MNLAITKWILIVLLLNCAPASAQDPAVPDFGDFAASLGKEVVDSTVASNGAEICAEFEPMPLESCKSILTAAGLSFTSGSSDAIKETLKTELTDPDFLNSALQKAFGSNIPLGLEFKALDGESGDSILALGYSVDYEFMRRRVDSSGKWNRHYSLVFDASGTITENAVENPRNFLETRLTGFGVFSTSLPEQSLEFGLRLQDLAGVVAPCNDENAESPPPEADCQAAEKESTDMLNSAFEFVNAFQFYKIGIDAGVESDQRFDATQTVFSAFAYGQYESWGGQSLTSMLRIFPAARIGIDSVDPNSDSPRALAGDESSFTRFSGEFSLWIPLGTSTPMALTFNYRHYRELGASSIVKAADLDSYNLRTYSLSGPNGLYASYSSGRLPLDFQDQNVVELGWRTYFE